MSNLSVYVPAAGRRDAVVSYFAGNGVFYLFDMSARIAETELPVEASEVEVGEVGVALAEQLIVRSDEVVAGEAEVYEFTQDGVLLGWEVEVRTVPWDDEVSMF